MDDLMDAVRYSSPHEQVEKLRNKGLVINNVDYAVHELSVYGYYNIINGYKRPYTHMVNGKRVYNDGVTFEQIHSLFLLDHSIRNSIMAAMLDLEESLRASTADVIGKNISTDHHEYLKKIHYQDRSSRIEKFSTEGILRTLSVNAKSGKDPIRYYSDKYGIIPPWILLKGTYFSTLINYIRILKPEEKSSLIQKMYNFNDQNASMQCTKTFFSSALFVCLDYRNRAAHGGRIYDFDSDHADYFERDNEFYSIFPEISFVKSLSGVGRLLAILSMFTSSNAASILRESANAQISRHLSLFPDDKDVLESLVQTEINVNRVVWVSRNGNIFHSNPTCSGLTDPVQISIDSPEFKKYTPCKRCCR